MATRDGGVSSVADSWLIDNTQAMDFFRVGKFEKKSSD
jgi:hypothetical protein